MDVDPLYADALHLLGAIEHGNGNGGAAIDLLSRAVTARPHDIQFLNNFGAVLAANGKFADAVAVISRAIAIKPDFVEAYPNLGNALKALGRSSEAEATLRQAIALRPDFPDAPYNLAAIVLEAGRSLEAVQLLETANRLRPNWADAMNNLGSALQSAGRPADAMSAFRRAIEIRNNFAEPYSNLGNVLGALGQWDEAVAMSRVAATLKPDSADVLTNFGGALRGRGDVEEAVDVLQRAIALQPKSPVALGTLALVMKDRGELDESVALFRRSLSLRPDAHVAGTLLWTLYYLPDSTPESLWLEHKAWNETYAAPLASQIRPFANPLDPQRKLRVGFSSGDLNGSPIGRFIWPTIRLIDRAKIEFVCYSDTLLPDARTNLIRSATVCRDVHALSDAQLAEQIRADQVDILIDLALHTGRNRMLMFARKPAPVQVTYLNYHGTSGLATMDYRITDPYVRDEPGEGAFYSERFVELPRSYWCYEPIDEAGPVARGPVQRNGYITFGCLNGFGKVTAECIAMWCEILRQLPTSKLLLYCPAGSHRDRFQTVGIAGDRLEFVGRVSTEAYFRCYDRIDIALDSYPYPGGTTTCDALWMGVPVVNRVGKTAASRGGRSILSNVGLPELATTSFADYVSKAAALASGQAYLTQLRQNLRTLMQASPLMDAVAHTRAMEKALGAMWSAFCTAQSAR